MIVVILDYYYYNSIHFNSKKDGTVAREKRHLTIFLLQVRRYVSHGLAYFQINAPSIVRGVVIVCANAQNKLQPSVSGRPFALAPSVHYWETAVPVQHNLEPFPDGRKPKT